MTRSLQIDNLCLEAVMKATEECPAAQASPPRSPALFQKAWCAAELTDTDAVDRLHAISSSPLQQRLQVGPLQCLCMCQWRNVPAPPAEPLSSGCTRPVGASLPSSSRFKSLQAVRF